MSGEMIKKSKMSTEAVIGDMATSIGSIAKSIESLGDSHRKLLHVNQALTILKLDIEKEKKKKLNTTIDIHQGK